MVVSHPAACCMTFCCSLWSIPACPAGRSTPPRSTGLWGCASARRARRSGRGTTRRGWPAGSLWSPTRLLPWPCCLASLRPCMRPPRGRAVWRCSRSRWRGFRRCTSRRRSGAVTQGWNGPPSSCRLMLSDVLSDALRRQGRIMVSTEQQLDVDYLAGERAAIDSLRAQIAKLERELSGIVAAGFPHVSGAAVSGRRVGPRLLGLGELEEIRDRLVQRVHQAQCRTALRVEFE